MKKTIATVMAVFITSVSFPQKTISVDSAANYLGQTVIIICSKVYSAKALEKVTF